MDLVESLTSPYANWYYSCYCQLFCIETQCIKSQNSNQQ
ncbi:hypothetical protein T4A_4846 [Trichinella pseudospiralis]|uniref:Uncharacterized protein n=1 Tax=Trichinella pseudospiralis TaxID=6337 RepID=A0A0V1GK10_TRIPS|nr:hypothetical protein T4A_4846 [Trichinella pseudospiralis]KRY98179.1 hypothetical protein T4C_585 [Trichinella pseudospiralis]